MNSLAGELTRLKPNDPRRAEIVRVNSIDSHEAMLWFLSRGDECLNCGNLWDQLFGFPTTLIIRIHKSAG
jgi:hypothetical protein